MQSHFMMFCEPAPETRGKERREEARRALCAVRRWPAGKSAALEAARSSIRGGGWAPSGPASPLGAPSQPEPPCALRGGTTAELGHGKAAL
eukprot:scaffold66324_cov75-Phaeocystis_antarctica.AAC.1